MNWKAIFKVFVSIVLVLFVLGNLWQPFRGSSDFFVTTLCYLLAMGAFVYAAHRFKQKMYGVALAGVSLFGSLYAAEVYLRYVFKYPVTYTERQWGVYSSMYDSPKNKGHFIRQFFEPAGSLHLHVMPANHLRNYKTAEFDFTQEYTNSRGLRGALPKAGKKVICTLGDSFTESVGAPTDSTYPKLLGDMIAVHDSSYVVMNGGVSGSDPFFEFMLLKDLKSEYAISDAVFMLNSSDIVDVVSRGGKERFVAGGKLQFRKAPWWEPLYAVSFVFRLMMHNIGGYGYNLMTVEQRSQEERKAIEAIKNHFAEDILPWAKNNNVRVHLVLQPMPASVIKRDAGYEQMHHRLSAIEGIRFLDIQPALHQIPDIQNYYWPVDGHFNAVGYQLTAQLVFDSLLRQ